MSKSEQTFKAYVDESIKHVIEFETRYHVLKAMGTVHDPAYPVYILPFAMQKVIDEKKEKAAFVLCEQIDTDRMSSDTIDMLIEGYKRAGLTAKQIDDIVPSDVKAHGFLGDQFRYTIWHIDGHVDMKRIFEDHAYIRNAANKFTGTIGRDAGVEIKELVEDGVIASISDQTSKDPYATRTVKIDLDGRISSYDKTI